MITVKKKKKFPCKDKIIIQEYSNGQNAIYLQNRKGEPLAELTIKCDELELRSNETIIKDYAENSNLINNLLESGFIESTNRFVIIGSCLYPICQISF